VPETVLLDITVVILLGIGAQWLAWRFRLPSILLLLVVGFLAGPVLGFLDPQALQGDWLFAFVSLSIGIILFEGGLSLRLDELREVGTAVLNLITIGVLVTWGLSAVATHFILGFNVELAVLIGAILIVTGPTVVMPLLRHVRPKGRVNTIAKWEGITIDPVGAILAVLTLETLLLLNDPQRAAADASAAVEHVIVGLGLEIFVALGVSVAASMLLIFILYRRMVPDFLRNPVTLMIVVVAFVVSNVLQHESGLLTTTLMGIAVANQPYVSVNRIVEFKENLQVLLIGSLFVLLSARLELSALNYIDTRVLVFLGLLVVLVRPLAVLLSSIGTNLEWEEKAFLSWMAPRGIVAAAVASLFAYQLRSVYPDAIDGMVPVIFAVIVGTVAIYGLTAAPLAQWLGLAEPNPNGLLFVGAAPWVRTVATRVQEIGFSVMLVDNNPDHVAAARSEGLPAHQSNALSESALDDIDLSGLGRLLITMCSRRRTSTSSRPSPTADTAARARCRGTCAAVPSSARTRATDRSRPTWNGATRSRSSRWPTSFRRRSRSTTPTTTCRPSTRTSPSFRSSSCTARTTWRSCPRPTSSSCGLRTDSWRSSGEAKTSATGRTRPRKSRRRSKRPPSRWKRPCRTTDAVPPGKGRDPPALHFAGVFVPFGIGSAAVAFGGLPVDDSRRAPKRHLPAGSTTSTPHFIH